MRFHLLPHLRLGVQDSPDRTQINPGYGSGNAAQISLIPGFGSSKYIP